MLFLSLQMLPDLSLPSHQGSTSSTPAAATTCNGGGLLDEPPPAPRHTAGDKRLRVEPVAPAAMMIKVVQAVVQMILLIQIIVIVVAVQIIVVQAIGVVVGLEAEIGCATTAVEVVVAVAGTIVAVFDYYHRVG